MAIFSSTEIHTSHTNKTQGTEPVLHRNQHAVNYRVKNHKIVSLQNEPPCYGSGQRSGHFQAGFLEGVGVSLNLGASTHSLLISEMFPKGDNEYFSVNCSFCISSRLLALAGLNGDSRPSRDQDVSQRHRPSCQRCRKATDTRTRTGQENCAGAIGGGRNKGEMVGGGGGANPQRP